jgi:EAL domain-containing protein (putative c-di-GMP-specific phosphodiesterase class I)
MAVNLSARQFQKENFLQSVRQILQETGMPSSCLELELAESTLMEHTEETVNILRDLNQSRIRIVIDDFGSGWSSLSYLKQLPIHKLKIDASLLSRVGSDSDNSAIVSAIIAMAHSLQMQAAAEGVEHKTQLDFLRQQRCDAVQGYYISPPLCGEAFTEFLKTAQYRNLLPYP